MLPPLLRALPAAWEEAIPSSVYAARRARISGRQTTSWEHDEFAFVLAEIMEFQRCETVFSTPPLFANGDWTAALHWNLEPGPNVLIYYHGRDDATPFP